MILTKYSLICDECGDSITPNGVSSIETVELFMSPPHSIPALSFHFHPNQVCKERWIENHTTRLTGTIIDKVVFD